MARNYSYLKRVFLNPVSTTRTSWILAQVGSSIHGSERGANNVLEISDCERRIILDFYLGTARHRRQSLRKINLLLQVLTDFKTALEKESNLIEKYEPPQNHKEIKPIKRQPR